MFRYYSFSGSYAAGTVLFTIVITMFLYVAEAFITRWNLFTKAGERGWKSLIPVYSDFVEWNIVGMGREFIILLIGAAAVSLTCVIFAFLGMFGMTLIWITLILFGVIVFIVTVRKGMRMAACFGKSDLFGLMGLVVCPFFGNMILSWGQCTFTPYMPEMEYDALGNPVVRNKNLFLSIFSDIKAGRVIDG